MVFLKVSLLCKLLGKAPKETYTIFFWVPQQHTKCFVKILGEKTTLA